MFINNNLKVKIDEEYKILWIGVDFDDRLCYSPTFLENLTKVHDLISYFIKKEDVEYVVYHTLNKNIWNLGGDLDHFVHCITSKNRNLLKDYAYKCIDLVYNLNNSYNFNICSTCVIQGNAFGGGFESALAGNYIIAESSAKFSFPEVIFGSFPGMGAYSFLTKRIGYKKANEIIYSNKSYTANELLDLGIIDEVCEDGHGISEMSLRIKNGDLKKYVNDPFQHVVSRVPKEELLSVVDLWVERAFSLSDENLKRMLKLASFQQRKIDKEKQDNNNYNLSEEQKTQEINNIINNSFKNGNGNGDK